MHPNGQLPAYEWAFSDVNPPVHAWAAWRVYKIEQKIYGCADRQFLERVFQKLLLNFTWWVNCKDAEGKNIFQGGFLGMDNIGVFDRSAKLPISGYLEQADGTSWMAMYALNMLTIALELAKKDIIYEDIASKFFEHFLRIADAMNGIGGAMSLWDEDDGFYVDADLELFALWAAGVGTPVTNTVAELTQRSPHSFEQFAQDLAHGDRAASFFHNGHPSKTVEKVIGGFSFGEGPVYDSKGCYLQVTIR